MVVAAAQGSRTRPLVRCRGVHVETTTADALSIGADAVAIGVFEDEELPIGAPMAALEALLASGEAKRSFKHVALTHVDGRRVILAGLGPRTRFDAERARVVAAQVHRRARDAAARTLCWPLVRPATVGLPDVLVIFLVQGAAVSLAVAGMACAPMKSSKNRSVASRMVCPLSVVRGLASGVRGQWQPGSR